MAKPKLGKSRKDTDFGRELIAGLKEAIAHARGEIVLPTRTIKNTKPSRKDKR